MRDQRIVTPALYRCLPFAACMVFVGLEEFIAFSARHGFVSLGDTALHYLYPIRTLIVACLLFTYKKEFSELTLRDLANIPVTLSICGLGLLVFTLWIRMDWTLGVTRRPPGFNPELLPRDMQFAMILLRVAGAVLVVPFMEELFWRSFLIRYIIDRDFQKVPLGTFTWPSFLLTVLLFGIEHNFFLAGMMAGAILNLILYKTRSIAQCVLAHAITNLAIAIYVLFTGKWQFW
jgi:CAAX protease family protein